MITASSSDFAANPMLILASPLERVSRLGWGSEGGEADRQNVSRDRVTWGHESDWEGKKRKTLKVRTRYCSGRRISIKAVLYVSAVRTF